MPKANWGIGASDVDEFDRDSQYKPYTGPEPTNGVYVWNINVLKFVSATKEKQPQLRVGLELVPREGREEEEQYEGYFTMAFLTVMEKTAFVYVPFLDAIGVSGREFTQRTITDEEGNIKKIGSWRNTGDVLIMAQLGDGTDANNKPIKKIKWFGAYEEDAEEEVDDGEYYDDEGDLV
jgi:hypothetical protein